MKLNKNIIFYCCLSFLLGMLFSYMMNNILIEPEKTNRIQLTINENIEEVLRKSNENKIRLLQTCDKNEITSYEVLLECLHKLAKQKYGDDFPIESLIDGLYSIVEKYGGKNGINKNGDLVEASFWKALGISGGATAVVGGTCVAASALVDTGATVGSGGPGLMSFAALPEESGACGGVLVGLLGI